jgi:Fur family ferric uptake transcriptional regulator
MSSGDDLHTIAAGRVRAEGQRYTAVRESLVAALVGAGKPLKIADVLAACPGVPQSSAYRNLAVLEQSGVVRRVITDEGFARYELAEDLTVHHHHLVCSSCGRVEDVTVPSALETSMDRTLDRLARRTGFAHVSHRLDLIGTCRDCA